MHWMYKPYEHKSAAIRHTCKHDRAQRKQAGTPARTIGRLLFMVVVCALVFASGAVFHSFASSDTAVEYVQVQYGTAVSAEYSPVQTDDIRLIVQPGDTLWQLAAQYVPDQGDLRPVIEQIRDYNDLSASSLQAGQVLHIPAVLIR